MRVDVDRVVEASGFGRRREVAHDVIVVRAARVLGADRNHALGAAEVRTHAAHVDADHVAGVRGHDAAAVTDLLVNREQQGNLAAERDLAGGDGAGEADEDRGRELVIQEATLDVAALRDRGARVHGDDVTCLNAQSQDLVLRGHVLVEEDLHVLLDLLDLVVGDVGGGLGVEDDTGVGAAVTRVDGAVLAIRGAPLVAAEGCGAQTAVVLDGTDHGTERVDVTGEHEGVALAAQLDEHVALVGDFGRKAEFGEGLHEVVRCMLGVAGGAGDGGELREALRDVGEVGIQGLLRGRGCCLSPLSVRRGANDAEARASAYKKAPRLARKPGRLTTSDCLGDRRLPPEKGTVPFQVT